MNFITGVARSGTTLTSQVMRACGADFGDNITHLMEDKKVRSVVNSFLDRNGFDPLGQNPLPTHFPKYPNFREDMPDLEIVKQCKLLLIWPNVVEAYPDAKWVIVRRDKDKIVDSCLTTSFMNKHRNAEGWSQWADFYLKQIEEVKARVDYVEVWPKQFKEDTEYTGMQEAVEFLGYNWNYKAARGCLCRSKLQ